MTRSLAWAAYIKAVEAVCSNADQPDFEPERHAEALRRLSDTLDFADEALVERFEALSHGQRDHYVTQPVLRTATCGIMLVSFIAGGGVGLHDHPDQSGFILCCRGQMKVDAYDVVSDAPLRLKRACEVEASTGDCISLTPTRGNIHRLQCTEPTWLVDIFTPPLSAEGYARVRAFALGDEVEPGVYLSSLLAERSLS